MHGDENLKHFCSSVVNATLVKSHSTLVIWCFKCEATCKGGLGFQSFQMVIDTLWSLARFIFI